MFDKKIAEQHLQKMLKRYKITVVAYSTTSSGWARWRNDEIKIPKPTNADRFGVCMHEVKHILDGNFSKLRFEQEFDCDMFAREQILQLNMGGVDAWDKRMNWHCLSRIAMAVNRGLNHSKIPKYIRDWFFDVDFSIWIGCKVFVQRDTKQTKGYRIKVIKVLETII